ncbi:MAG: S8 family serine peptidase [Proteobacteria bacterium]|nr:S8 family serine peptidase [Pseudomonadota bacterium]
MALAALLLVPRPAAAQDQRTRGPLRWTSGGRVDGLVVKFKSERGRGVHIAATPAARAADLSARAGRALAHGRVMSGDSHVFRFSGPTSLADAEAAAALLRDDPDVEYAAPDRKMFPSLAPNDPHYTSIPQWHLYPSSIEGGGINAPAAWDVTTGASSVVVAVLDTGILSHGDIDVARKVSGYDFVSYTLNGDGNARDADPSDPGDYGSANECGFGEPAHDSSWHGTHVAGTIGAATNNSLRVAGVNWTSKILPVRVLGKCGGDNSDIIDAIRWAAGIAVAGVPNNTNPAKVINMSLGGDGACDGATQSAINDATAAGALVVVAAGNSAQNASGSSPASCSNVVTVAAVGRLGEMAAYTNFGSAVAIAAPGGNGAQYVWSLGNFSDTTPGADATMGLQGTSMATPHVAGVASLVFSVNPALTPAQVKGILIATSRAFPGGTGSDCSTSLCGAGIVDANAAVRQVSPSASIITPSNGAIVSGGSVSLQVATSGGVVGVQYKIDGANLGSEVPSPFATFWDTTQTTDGSHSLTAVARNAAGLTTTSSAVSVIVDNNAPIISAVAASAISPTGATISWTTNEAADTQVEYGQTAAYGSQTTLNTTLVTSHSAGLTGLTGSTLYHYRVKSRDAAGRLTTSADVTFTTAGLPTVSIASPAGGAVVAGSVTLVPTVNSAVAGVQWKIDGSNLGAEVTVSPFTTAWNSTLASPGSHTIGAVARDGFGNSVTATPVVVTVDNTAPVLSAISATPSTGSAVVSWSTDEAATTLVEYGLTASYGASTALDATLSGAHAAGIGGLSPNVLYHYRVKSQDGPGNLAVSGDQTFTTLAKVPVVAASTGATTSSVSAVWGASDGNPSGTQYLAERATDAGFTANLVNSGWITVKTFAFGGLLANTRYHLRVRSRNSAAVESAPVVLPTLATLANAPASASVLSITYSSITFQWTPLPAAPADLSADGYRLDVAQNAGFTLDPHTVSVAGPQNASLGMADLEAFTTYYLRVGSLNVDGVPNYAATVSTRTLFAAAAKVVVNTQPITLSLTPSTPEITNVRLQVPALSLPTGVTLKVTTGVSFVLPPAGSNQARLTAMGPGVGLEITADGSQPAYPVVITMAYDPNFLQGNDPRTIKIAAYSPSAQQWSILPTSVDTRARTITAVTPHFSLFAPFFTTAGTSVEEAQIFPIPWQPGSGGGHFDAQSVTFSNLPPESRVSLYTIHGELLWQGNAGLAGVLEWSGDNRYGGRVGTGTYLAVIDGGGQKTTRRVVVIR